MVGPRGPGAGTGFCVDCDARGNGRSAIHQLRRVGLQAGVVVVHGRNGVPGWAGQPCTTSLRGGARTAAHSVSTVTLPTSPYAVRRTPHQAGAAHVYAVDGSAGAVDAARRIVRANGLEDRITVVHGEGWGRCRRVVESG